jgi:hypothetical protein
MNFVQHRLDSCQFDPHGADACNGIRVMGEAVDTLIHDALAREGQKAVEGFIALRSRSSLYKGVSPIVSILRWYTHANNIKLTGIVYLHRIMDNKVGGSAMKNLRMFRALCGNYGLGSVVLATTHWSKVTPE